MTENAAAKYAMRRKERTITDPQLLEKLFRRVATCRLAFQDTDNGVPYIVPLTFGYAEGRLVFHAAKKGRKIDLIGRTGRAAFEIDLHSDIVTGEKACNWTVHFASLVGWGEIRLLEDDAERLRALRVLMRHHGYQGEPTFSPQDLKMTAVIELKIRELSGKTSDPDWLCRQLDAEPATPA